MTVIMPLGHTFTRQVLPRSNYLLTRFASTNSLLCAPRCATDAQDQPQHNHLAKFTLSRLRSYATAAASKPGGRPKAHTGRTTTKRSPAKAKATTTKKTPAKKTTSKAKPRSRAKAKPKAKPKPKPRGRKAPTKTALNRARIAKTKDLKAKALLNEPKQLPSTAWTVMCTERSKGTKSVAEGANVFKSASSDYKNLPAEEHERLNHTANQNKAKNVTEYKKWLSQFSPLEIKQANVARDALNAAQKAAGKKRAPIRHIQDERLVKLPTGAYIFFTKDRFASGDFKHMTIAESSKLIGREWKALSAAEKKPYEESAAQEKNRYEQERATVYGVEDKPKTPRKPKSTAAST